MRLPYFLCLCVASLFCSTLVATPPSSLVKKRVLADLDAIQNIFDVKYAPKSWKGEFAKWDLDLAILEAKSKLNCLSVPTLKQCQVIVRDFFNSTRDYHVGVRFFSTESSSLPFLIKGAQGRYFIAYIDRDQLSRSEFPYEEGDEVLTFDNRPTHAVVEELRKREFGNNTLETDQALAELSLTHRRGDLGQQVCQGKIEITCLAKGSKNPQTSWLKWSYVPERIRDLSKLDLLDPPVMAYEHEEGCKDGLRALLTSTQFCDKMMVAHMWDKSYVGASLEMNKHALGARTSFVPQLGRKVWKSAYDSIFDAYIFETPSGKKIGYIRLPHYIGDEEEVEEFGLTMNLFQKKTDALVIDQLNNPGGSVFYLYALAATLTDTPLYTPKHHLAMTQEEVYVANLLLSYLKQVSNDETARMVLGESVGGYPVDYEFVRLMTQFCHFLIQQWNSGKLYSDPTFFFGVDEVRPHPKYRYTRPILLLVNSLDFSGGDFFPAIMQDNKRAVVFGTRTAGAGGYVLSTSFPNHSGMKGFVMTGSLAKRIDQQPIENLGVVPDIQYDLSIVDLQEGYRDYTSAIVNTLESMTSP